MRLTFFLSLGNPSHRSFAFWRIDCLHTCDAQQQVLGLPGGSDDCYIHPNDITGFWGHGGFQHSIRKSHSGWNGTNEMDRHPYSFHPWLNLVSLITMFIVSILPKDGAPTATNNTILYTNFCSSSKILAEKVKLSLDKYSIPCDVIVINGLLLRSKNSTFPNFLLVLTLPDLKNSPQASLLL